MILTKFAAIRFAIVSSEPIDTSSKSESLGNNSEPLVSQSDSAYPTEPERKSKSKWLLLLLLLIALGGGVGGYWMMQPGSGVSDLLQGIAELTYTNRRVESRRAGTIEWNAAQLHEDLFEGDAVKTNANASALIEFTDDEQIRLGEQALIIIRGSYRRQALRAEGASDEAELEIINGFVETKTKAVELTVNLPQGQATVKPSEQQENLVYWRVRSGEDSEVAVVRGAVAASINGQAVKAEAGDVIAASPKGTVKVVKREEMTLAPLPTINRPENGSIHPVLPGYSSRSVFFQWAGYSKESRLQIARDPDFQQAVFDGAADSSSKLVKGLQDGNYFWRLTLVGDGSFRRTPAQKFSVASLDGKGVNGALGEAHQLTVKKFDRGTTLVRDGKPQSLTAVTKMQANDVIRTKPGTQAIFSPSSPKLLANSSGYSPIEVLPYSSLKLNQVRQLPGQLNYVDSTLEHGQVKLRYDPSALNEEKTEPGRGRPEQNVYQLSTSEQSLPFSAEQYAPIGVSEVLISKTKPNETMLTVLKGSYTLPKSDVESQSTNSSSLPEVESSPKVRAGQSLVWSSSGSGHGAGLSEGVKVVERPIGVPVAFGQTTKIVPPLVQPLGAVSGIAAAAGTLVSLVSPKASSSTTSSRADRTFQVAQQPNFAGGRTYRNVSSVLPVTLDKPGNYYWRYRDGRGPWSEVSSLNYSPSARLNDLSSPSDRDTFQVPLQKPVVKVPYQGKPPQLRWVWPKDSSAAAYQVELFTSRKAVKPLFQSVRTTDQKIIAVVDALGLGTYWWRLLRFDFRGRTLGSSKLRRLDVAWSKKLPAFSVMEPSNNFVTSAQDVLLRGRANGEGGLKVNQTKIIIQENGIFAHRYPLRVGKNDLLFSFQDEQGIVTKVNYLIFRDK